MGRRGRRRPQTPPPVPEDAAAWLPQTAARRDALYEQHGKGQPPQMAKDRALTDAELIEAADKYELPDSMPASTAACVALRDQPNQMTAPMFRPNRHWLYVAGRPVVVTCFSPHYATRIGCIGPHVRSCFAPGEPSATGR